MVANPQCRANRSNSKGKTCSNKDKAVDKVATNKEKRPAKKFCMRKVTKLAMLGYAHCAFVDCLYMKCHAISFDPKYNHKKPILLVQLEGYTSKTCAKCS